MLKRIIFVLMGMVIILFSSCQNKQEKPKILLILKTKTNQFFVDMENGARAAINDLKNNQNINFELIVKAGNNEGDTSSQKSYLSIFKNDRFLKCIVITPAGDDRNIKDMLEFYEKKGVVLINLDTPIEMEGWKYRIYSDNELGGYCEAKNIINMALKESKSNKLNILILGGVPDHSSSIARINGYKKAIDEMKSVGVKIEYYLSYADWRYEKAKSEVSSKGLDKDIVIAANDNMAIGAVDAYEMLGKKIPPPYIAGFDNIDSVRELISRENKIQLTISQDPYAMGYLGVYACVDKIDEAIKSLRNRKKDFDISRRNGKDIILKTHLWDREAYKSEHPKQCEWSK